MKFNTKVIKEDYKKITAYSFYLQKYFMFICLAAVVIVTFIYGKGDCLISIITSVVTVLLFSLLVYCITYFTLKKNFALQTKNISHSTIEIEDGKLMITDIGFSDEEINKAEVALKNYYKIVETKNYIFIHPSKVLFVVVSKREISETMQAALSRMLKEANENYQTLFYNPDNKRV